MMNYCASVYCVDSFSSVNSVWHDFAYVYCVDSLSSVNSVWHDFAYVYRLLTIPNDYLSLTPIDGANAKRG